MNNCKGLTPYFGGHHYLPANHTNSPIEVGSKKVGVVIPCISPVLCWCMNQSTPTRFILYKRTSSPRFSLYILLVLDVLHIDKNPKPVCSFQNRKGESDYGSLPIATSKIFYTLASLLYSG